MRTLRERAPQTAHTSYTIHTHTHNSTINYIKYILFQFNKLVRSTQRGHSAAHIVSDTFTAEPAIHHRRHRQPSKPNRLRNYKINTQDTHRRISSVLSVRSCSRFRILTAMRKHCLFRSTQCPLPSLHTSTTPPTVLVSK